MASFVSSILHSSANKIERTILGSGKKDSGTRSGFHASNGPSLYHPSQMNCNTEPISAPPPYDTMHPTVLTSPIPTPSTSWTSEMSALAEKIKDDVTNTLKGNSKSNQQQVDRYGISQGMKLVSIAADEYEGGNESVALNLYLTGVDKILMALPNKTDLNTKRAIREKLQSVEERVGILNLASSEKKLAQQQKGNPTDSSDTRQSTLNTYILSHLASAISTFSGKAYQTTMPEEPDDNVVRSKAGYDSHHVTTTTNQSERDSMVQFKRLGQYITDFTVATAVLIKQSPLPDLISYLLNCLYQLLLWADSQYHIIQKLRNASVHFVKLGLQADEKYRIHEYLSEGVYMSMTAGLKAAVAFKEAPGHKDLIEPEPTRCSPQAPQKARTSWLWTSRQ